MVPQSNGGIIRRHRGLLLVLLLGLTLNTLGLGWGLPNDHSWNPDDISPNKPVKVLKKYQSGWDKYPYMQFWVNFAASAPLLWYWHSQGTFRLTSADGDPHFADRYRQHTQLMLIARLLSVLMSLGTLYWVYRLTESAFADRFAATVAGVLTATANVFVFHAQLGNVDVPYLFWFTWSMYHYLQILQTGARRHYLAFGLLAAFSLATKEGIVGAYVLTGLLIYLYSARSHYAEHGRALRALLDHRPWLVLLVVLAAYALINNVVFNYDGYSQHFLHWVGPDAAGTAQFSKEHRGGWWLLEEVYEDVGKGMGAGALVLALLGVLVGLRGHRRVSLVLLVPIVSYYLFTILPIHYNRPRFMLPIIVMLSCFGGLLAATLWRAWPRWRPLSALLIGLPLLQALLMSAHVLLLMNNDSRYGAERWLLANVPRDEPVAMVGSRKFVPRLGYLGYQRAPPPKLHRDDDKAPLPSPRVVLVNLGYGTAKQAKQISEALKEGALGYRLVWREHYRSPLEGLVGNDHVSHFINSKILIFQKDDTGKS